MNSLASSAVFADYAAIYDLIYSDKDYKGEVRFVDALCKRFVGSIRHRISVLDLACGTGRHAIQLARLGYNVRGSDISRDMVRVAQSAARAAALGIEIHNKSFQNCDSI